MKRHLSIILISATMAGTAWAATPLPVWYGDPDTTRQGYTFPTNNPEPAPQIPENPYGTPTANIVIGDYGAGWYGSGALSGVNADGAWDLGLAGSFTVVCKFAADPPPPGATFSVEFQVYSVAYLGITSLPTLDTLGLSAQDLNYTQTLVKPDVAGNSWQGQTWTGTFTGLRGNEASFRILAPTDNVAVIDTVEVFTRYTVVPEPSVWVLGTLPSVGLLLVRRRGQPVRY